MSHTEPIGFVCGTRGDSVSFLVKRALTHYPEYLSTRKQRDCGLPECPKLSIMDQHLKRMKSQERIALE